MEVKLSVFLSLHSCYLSFIHWK